MRRKSLNPIEIRIENDRVQKILEGDKKECLEGILFSSGIKNKTDEMFLVARRIGDAKSSLINDSLYKIEKWDGILFLVGKKSVHKRG